MFAHVALALGLALGPTPTPAYTAPRVNVLAEVDDIGDIKVTADYTLTFTRDDRSAYVDLPRTRNMFVDNISIKEGGTSYKSSFYSAIDSRGEPGLWGETFCEANAPHRIVWYFDAKAGTTRTFRLGYTLKGSGTTSDYGAHTTVHLPVWAANWATPLNRLDVKLTFPRRTKPTEAFSTPPGALRVKLAPGRPPPRRRTSPRTAR